MIRSFFAPKETSWVLEVLPGEVRATSLVLDTEKRIQIRRHWQGESWRDLPKSFRFTGQVIVSIHATLATTTIIPVGDMRENPDEPLVANELENLISRAVGKIFNQCRQAAARELRVDEIDIFLAKSRVINFKLDDHVVLNPVGFRAEKIEAVLELMLTTRPLIGELKQLFKERREIFFTQTERAILLDLEKLHGPPLGLLELGEESFFFLMEKAAVGEMLSRGKFNWSPQMLLHALAGELSVSGGAARKIYHAFLRGEVSANMGKHIKKALDPQLKLFYEELGRTRLRGKVFVLSGLPLPISLPQKRQNLILSEPPLTPMLDHFGLALAPYRPETCRRPFEVLAPWLEFYLDKSDSKINQWLRRHLNWLGPVHESQAGPGQRQIKLPFLEQ